MQTKELWLTLAIVPVESVHTLVSGAMVVKLVNMSGTCTLNELEAKIYVCVCGRKLLQGVSVLGWHNKTVYV